MVAVVAVSICLDDGCLLVIFYKNNYNYYNSYNNYRFAIIHNLHLFWNTTAKARIIAKSFNNICKTWESYTSCLSSSGTYYHDIFRQSWSRFAFIRCRICSTALQESGQKKKILLIFLSSIRVCWINLKTLLGKTFRLFFPQKVPTIGVIGGKIPGLFPWKLGNWPPQNR